MAANGRDAVATKPVTRTARSKKAAPRVGKAVVKTASSKNAVPAAKPSAAKLVPAKLAPAKSARRKAPTKLTSAKQTSAKQTSAKQPPAKQPPAKRTAVKLVAIRRKPAAKLDRHLDTPKEATSAHKPPAKPQRFTVSHLNEADFRTDGLRPYARYRDLGVAAATGGLCQAHVIRLVPPCTDEVRKRHAHDTELQLVYVLKGWVKNEFEGHGEQMMSQGSCWIQPPGIPHTVLDYSADAELLEIVVPADFKTAEL